MTWETVAVVAILLVLLVLLVALVMSGDRLDNWGPERPKKQALIDHPTMVYGMSLRQIRRLRAYYIARTNDASLERL